MTPLTDSTSLQHDAAALRANAQRDGYLLIRGLLDRDEVVRVGDALGDIMARSGWIETGKTLASARANADARCVEPQPAFMDVFYEQLSLQSLHALKASSDLMTVFERLFGETPFCVPHCVTRMAFPDMDAYATPAHQDFVHFEGSRNNWAAWIPFTSIHSESGGLEVASGSHLAGPYDMRPSLGAGQMIIDAPLEEFDWRWSPMEPGDVLIHNCLTVHRGRPNNTDTMRVSVDARYQPLSEPVGEKYLGVSHQMRDWDDLYRHWPDDQYKYYWKALPLEVVPFTFEWYDRRDERAIVMGEAGDPESAVALENITLKHRNPSMRERAAAALAALNSHTT